MHHGELKKHFTDYWMAEYYEDVNLRVKAFVEVTGNMSLEDHQKITRDTFKDVYKAMLNYAYRVNEEDKFSVLRRGRAC